MYTPILSFRELLHLKLKKKNKLNVTAKKIAIVFFKRKDVKKVPIKQIISLHFSGSTRMKN